MSTVTGSCSESLASQIYQQGIQHSQALITQADNQGQIATSNSVLIIPPSEENKGVYIDVFV